MNFLKNLIHHFFYGVIEKNWNQFMKNIEEKVNVFEDIIQHHSVFLDSCFNEALLMDEKIRTIIMKLQILFIFFNDNTQDFIMKSIILDPKTIMLENKIKEKESNKVRA